MISALPRIQSRVTVASKISAVRKTLIKTAFVLVREPRGVTPFLAVKELFALDY